MNNGQMTGEQTVMKDKEGREFVAWINTGLDGPVGIPRRGLPKEEKVQYVLAEGSRVNGLGRFEVYEGGQLTLSIPLQKGSNRLCFGYTVF